MEVWCDFVLCLSYLKCQLSSLKSLPRLCCTRTTHHRLHPVCIQAPQDCILLPEGSYRSQSLLLRVQLAHRQDLLRHILGRLPQSRQGRCRRQCTRRRCQSQLSIPFHPQHMTPTPPTLRHSSLQSIHRSLSRLRSHRSL